VRDHNSLFPQRETELPEEVQCAHILRNAGAAKVDRLRLRFELQHPAAELTAIERWAMRKLVNLGFTRYEN
jgi:hypothetical protein